MTKHDGNAIRTCSPPRFSLLRYLTVSLVSHRPHHAAAAPNLSLRSVSMTKSIRQGKQHANTFNHLQSVYVEFCHAPFFQFWCPWSLQAYLPTCSTSSTFAHWYSKHMDNLTVLVPSCQQDTSESEFKGLRGEAWK